MMQPCKYMYVCITHLKGRHKTTSELIAARTYTYIKLKRQAPPVLLALVHVISISFVTRRYEFRVAQQTLTVLKSNQ